MGTTTALTTFEEFVNLPDPTSGHLELHHGEVVLVPPPKRTHTQIQKRIEKALERILDDQEVVVVEMPFRPNQAHEVWVADIAVLKKSVFDAPDDDNYLLGAPDIVIEVLSPRNTADEIDDKRTVCLENGCKSFWIVSPKRKTVEIHEVHTTWLYKMTEPRLMKSLAFA